MVVGGGCCGCSGFFRRRNVIGCVCVCSLRVNFSNPSLSLGLECTEFSMKACFGYSELCRSGEGGVKGRGGGRGGEVNPALVSLGLSQALGARHSVLSSLALPCLALLCLL